MKVRKRNGKIVDFDKSKIQNAILKAFKACNIEDASETAYTIASRIEFILSKKYKNDEAITIDEIQNLVESQLMDEAHIYGENVFNVAKKYILYRDRRDKDRENPRQAFCDDGKACPRGKTRRSLRYRSHALGNSR